MFELSIKEFKEKMVDGDLLPSDLVTYYLDRIKKFDGKTRAVLQINSNAIDLAKKMDDQIETESTFPLLFGMPILLKDNIDTTGLPTTAGSMALKDHVPTTDATIVSKLKEAGAIILGKTNLSEWANFRGKRSISGWSSLGGQTRNPFFLNRTPCGSSSGSAVAVAADFCIAAIGTETDGSIVCPSHVNGIVGVKPTIGLVSRKGIIPISHTQDTAGPMARSVEDAAFVLEAISGYDPNDKTTILSKDVKTDYSNYEKTDLDKFTIGIPRQFYSFSPKIEKIMNEKLKTMKEMGTELIDPIEIALPEDGLFETHVLLTDYKEDLNAYLKTLNKNLGIDSIEDLISFNMNHPDETMPFFGQEWFELALETEGFESEKYKHALENYEKLRNHLRDLFEGSNLDAIFLPSGSPAWPIDTVNGDCSSGSTSFLAATTGFPSMTIPIGEIQGLPFGGSILGLPFSEKTLFSLADAMEKTIGIRLSPKFLAEL